MTKISYTGTVGAPFDEYVKKELDIRTYQIQGQPDKYYSFTRNAWVKLISSVNYHGNNLKDIPKWNEYVLSNQPSSKDNNKLRFGITGNNPLYNHNQSQGFNPVPGIVSVQVDTAGRLQSLRTAKVNFKVHSVEEFNKIDFLFFRLGYSCLLEWGHTRYFQNTTKVNSPIPIIDLLLDGDKYSPPPLDKINMLINTNRIITNGNQDGLIGLVTNFSWEIGNDGSYDCTLTLVGVNSLAFSNNTAIWNGSFPNTQDDPEDVSQSDVTTNAIKITGPASPSRPCQDQLIKVEKNKQLIPIKQNSKITINPTITNQHENDSFAFTISPEDDTPLVIPYVDTEGFTYKEKLITMYFKLCSNTAVADDTLEPGFWEQFGQAALTGVYYYAVFYSFFRLLLVNTIFGTNFQIPKPPVDEVNKIKKEYKIINSDPFINPIPVILQVLINLGFKQAVNVFKGSNSFTKLRKDQGTGDLFNPQYKYISLTQLKIIQNSKNSILNDIVSGLDYSDKSDLTDLLLPLFEVGSGPGSFMQSLSKTLSTFSPTLFELRVKRLIKIKMFSTQNEVNVTYIPFVDGDISKDEGCGCSADGLNDPFTKIAKKSHIRYIPIGVETTKQWKGPTVTATKEDPNTGKKESLLSISKRPIWNEEIIKEINYSDPKNKPSNALAPARYVLWTKQYAIYTNNLENYVDKDNSSKINYELKGFGDATFSNIQRDLKEIILSVISKPDYNTVKFIITLKNDQYLEVEDDGDTRLGATAIGEIKAGCDQYNTKADRNFTISTNMELREIATSIIISLQSKETPPPDNTLIGNNNSDDESNKYTKTYMEVLLEIIKGIRSKTVSDTDIKEIYTSLFNDKLSDEFINTGQGIINEVGLNVGIKDIRFQKGYNSDYESSDYETNEEIRNDIPDCEIYKLLHTYSKMKYNVGGEDFVYIPLGLLLMLLNNRFIIKFDKENINNAFNIDFNTETNFYNTSDYHHSVDPKICMLPNPLNKEAIKRLIINYSKSLGKTENYEAIINQFDEKTINYGADVRNINDPNDPVPELYRGKLANSNRGCTMFILLNIDYILKVIKDTRTSEGLSIDSFLTELMKGVSESTGNLNNFKVTYISEANTIKIIDSQQIMGESPSIEDESSYGFQVYSSTSIAKNISLKTLVSPKIHSVLAITAQSGNYGQGGIDGSSFNIGDYNIDTKDVFKEAMYNESSDDPTYSNKEYEKTIKTFYSDIKRMYLNEDGSNQQKRPTKLSSDNKSLYSYMMGNSKSNDPNQQKRDIIPIALTITIDGISGIKPYQGFHVESPAGILPKRFYKDGVLVVDWVVSKVTHTIQNQEWLTDIEGLMINRIDNNRKGYVIQNEVQTATSAPVPSATFTTASAPSSERYNSERDNNPFNLRPNSGTQFNGFVKSKPGFRQNGTQYIGDFASFDTLENGIRAGMRNLSKNYFGRGINTIKAIINKYAPSSDGNDTNSYVRVVTNYFNKNGYGTINGDTPLPFDGYKPENFQLLKLLCEAIIIQEGAKESFKENVIKLIRNFNFNKLI